MGLDELWREDELAEELGIPIGKTTGKSRTISGWIREGLPYIEKSGRRYFLGNDATEFLKRFKKEFQTS